MGEHISSGLMSVQLRRYRHSTCPQHFPRLTKPGFRAPEAFLCWDWLDRGLGRFVLILPRASWYCSSQLKAPFFISLEKDCPRPGKLDMNLWMDICKVALEPFEFLKVFGKQSFLFTFTLVGSTDIPLCQILSPWNLLVWPDAYFKGFIFSWYCLSMPNVISFKWFIL